jgi:hypothetical protein
MDGKVHHAPAMEWMPKVSHELCSVGSAMKSRRGGMGRERNLSGSSQTEDLCGARSTIAKGSPPSPTVTERHRLLNPSMNTTGCSIRRWTPPAALTYCRRRVQSVPTIYSLRWASQFRFVGSRNKYVVDESDGIGSVWDNSHLWKRRGREQAERRQRRALMHQRRPMRRWFDFSGGNKWRRFLCSHDLMWTCRLDDVDILHVQRIWLNDH